MSRSPSPASHSLPPRSDTGSPFESNVKNYRRVGDAMHDFDASSPSTNSRDLTPSDSEMSDSEDEKEGKVRLPSIRELWGGRLPSDGSCLESGLRNLGIVKPLPAIQPLDGGHRNTIRGFHVPMEHGKRGLSLRDVGPSKPTLSPAVFGDESPMDTEEWRPAYRLVADSKWSHGDSPSGSRATPAYQEGSNYRTISRPRYHSVDSDSEDGYYAARSEHSHSPYHGSRPLSGYLHRSSSFDSDMDTPVSRRSSLRSLPPHDYMQSRRYHHSSSFSDHGSAADAYRMAEQRSSSESSWESYVEKAGRLNGAGPIMYTCRWKKHEGQTCNYTGKKQLAKRHVESVHLGKKPHVCPECRKPFPQKTSLDIHIRSVHTFDKPLKCEHCTACFSDPARRHKHYRVEHPDKVVKKPRMKIDFKDIEHLLVK